MTRDLMMLDSGSAETEQLCNLRYHIIVRDELSTVYMCRVAWKLPEMPPEIFNSRVFIPAAQY